MENVVLTIHLILALALIVVVLLQRSEGGGLGIGGGGGGVVSGRSAATALGKLTWLIVIAFICTSIALTVIAAKKSAGNSVSDLAPIESEGGVAAPEGDDLLPPSLEGDSLVPGAAE